MKGKAESIAEARLRSIYQTRTVAGKSGKQHQLHSEIDEEEGKLLRRVVDSDEGIRKSLEVGCAFGLASLHICASLAARPGAEHTIIDPFQHTEWDGVGLKNLDEAGIDFYRLVEKRSEFALPELLDREGATFDLVFIDGWHTFDHTLLDCFYATRLLRTGGYLVIDDVGIPAVRRCVSYISKYPCYRLHAQVTSKVSKWGIQFLAKTFLRCFPRSARETLFNSALLERAFERERPRAVAFKKVTEDSRNWNWFPPAI